MGYLRRHRTSYKHMPGFAPIRFAVAAGLALSAALPLALTVPLVAQSPPTPQATPSSAPQLPSATPLSSTLPATEPTTPAPPPVPLTPSQRPPARAQITFADGTLSVSADNSSLNQILRQIAGNTGMKITGGVSDERVFGHYGPAPTAQILAELLDGTDSNMILVQRDNNPEPAELILTPRQGGASPPNPNASAFDERSEPQEASPGRAAQPAPAAAPNYNSSVPPANPGAPATSPASATPLESPNGIKTPQQIYQQLQRLRAQQPAQQQPQTPPQ
jgi:hypothetical protein